MRDISEYNYGDVADDSGVDGTPETQYADHMSDCFVKEQLVIDDIFKQPEKYCIEVIQYPDDMSRWLVVLLERSLSMEAFALATHLQQAEGKEFNIEDAYKNFSIIYRTTQLYEHAEHFASFWAWTYGLEIYFNRRDEKQTEYAGYVVPREA